MSRLAINGGPRVRTTPFPRYNTIGEEEKQAAMKVLDGGVLSGFLGTWSAAFYGGALAGDGVGELCERSIALGGGLVSAAFGGAGAVGV